LPSADGSGDDGGNLFADEGLDRLWTEHGLITAWEEVMKLKRRKFLALSGVTLSAAAHEWLVANPARLAVALSGKRADAGVVADLNVTVDALRRLDDKLGGQAVYGMITEQLSLVVSLLRNTSYSQANGQALHGIAAELARLAGWTAYDSGNHGTAQRFYLLGLRAAHEADAPGIGANILRCMADQAMGTDDPGTAIKLLRSAKAGGQGVLTPTETAVLWAALGRAHGRNGEPDAARFAIDSAQSDMANSDPETDPPYIYWVSRPAIEFAAGESMLSSGQPASAIPHLRSSVADLGSGFSRDEFISAI
jgi:hypothetical protein